MQPTDLLKPLAPMPAIGAVGQVSDAQLARFADLIYRRAGIRVSPQKKVLLSNRLRRRLRDTGIEDFEQYYRHLVALRPDHPEWDAFLQEITTHETFLFRDQSHWEWFSSVFLAESGARFHRAGHVGNVPHGQRLRIWSAACSSGDEAFTAACCVAACLPELGRRAQILGTDLGVGVVEQAKRGAFGERAMRMVPEPYRRRFFEKAKDAPVWQARPILRDMVSFRQHNLLEPLREAPFDLVFLKNVLIYFDKASKKTVLENVGNVLCPGGYLVVGAAEGSGDLAEDLVRVEPWLFRRSREAAV